MKKTNTYRRTKFNRVKRLCRDFALMVTVFFCFAGMASANPTGAQVVNGSVQISSSGNTLTITNSPNSIINWQTFSIASGETTNFIQQSATSTVLNRILGQDPSVILGALQSNGRVLLINPNGIIFGQGSRVDVNGLIASTLNISNEDFLADNYNFTAGPIAGKIQNQGTMTTPSGGFVYLIAPDIENSGIINTPGGDVILAAGHSVQLFDSLDPNIAVVVSAPADRAVNLGQIVAQSGTVGIYGGLIYQQGVVNADSAVVGENGKIILKAAKDVVLAEGSTTSAHGGNIQISGGMEDGTVEVAGTIDASAPNGGNGGFIETSAANVKIDDTAYITTLAPYGKTGTWLIDPTDFSITDGSDSLTTSGIGADTLETMLAGSNVTIATSTGGTEDGDINVNADVAWSQNTLSLQASGDININAVLTVNNTAALDLRAGYSTPGTDGGTYDSAYSVNVGFETDGTFKGHIDFYETDGVTPRSGTGFLTINGNSYTVITDLTALQNISSDLDGYYALGGNIDASPTLTWNDDGSGGYYGFNPIGYWGNEFKGVFDGLGHTITGLYINRPTTDTVGLFGFIDSASIRNVGMVDVDITGQMDVGGLVGVNNGWITNAYSTGDVTGTADSVGGLAGGNEGYIINSYSMATVSATGNNVGGLVGFDEFGSIAGSYSTGVVSGYNNVGGLVGYNDQGSITDSYNTATVNGTGDNVGGLVGYNNQGGITDSCNTGTVNGSNNNTGGLVGYNAYGYIGDSYNTGTVTGTGDNVGGLVGNNDNGSVDYSYNIGAVSGNNNVGGLVGYNYYGIVNYSYSSGDVTGNDIVGGLVGYNYNGGDVYYSYSTGTVTGTGSYVGGFAGYNAGLIADNYWDTDTSGQSTGIGQDDNAAYTVLNGMTTAQFMNQSYLEGLGFDFTSTWYMIDGSTRPFLQSEYSTTIVNAHQLQLMAMDLAAGYTLGANIDMTELTNDSGMWNTSTGFVPIGNSTTPFSGTFDGLDHTITGLYINLPTTDFVGLFGFGAAVSSLTTIQNVGLINVTITGKNDVGGLVGLNNGGVAVTNSYSTGVVNGVNNVGGLVGLNGGSDISGSSSASTVTGTGNNVGGLVGYNNNGTITNSSSTGTVTGTGDNVGGLVGYSFVGIISGSSSTSTVTGTGDNVGGLVGYSFGGSITDSSSTGSVSGANYVGGLVGYNEGGTITDSSSAGSASGTDYVGGLVGYNYDGSITDSYSTGDAIDSTVDNSGFYFGGLVGLNIGTISNSHYDIGNVKIKGSHYVTEGGLYSDLYSVWLANGKTLDITDYLGSPDDEGYYLISTVQNLKDMLGFIDDSTYTFRLTANLDLTFLPDWHLPVFGGEFDGAGYTLSNLSVNQPFNDNIGFIGWLKSGSTLTGLNLAGVNITGVSYVGGLAGYSEGTISHSSSTGTVNGSGDEVGGLVGYNYYGSITNSYNTGSVTGTGDYDVGGLVGYNDYGNITNSYNTGAVNGNAWVGGLVGDNSGGSITDSYNTGAVTASGDYDAGGLAGHNSGSITGSYNTAAINGVYDVGGLVGYNSNGSITYSYSTGSVTGTDYVGGLVGENDNGSISYSYSTGSVTGSSYVGGFIGYNYSGGSVTYSYWDTETSGQSTGISQDDNAAYTVLNGLTTAQMMTAGSFTGWDISNTGGSTAVWRIYDGYTYPLLRSFLTAVTVTANDASKTYNKSAYTGGNGVTYSTGTLDSNYMGTLSYAGTSQGAVNAGSYTITPSDYYSNQQGYDISFVNGTLTINKAALTITAATNTKTYDGTTSASATPTVSGLAGSDTVTGLTEIYDNKNAGTGKTLSVASYTVNDGNSGNNYTVTTVADTTGEIDQALLTITAVTNTKTYDGTTSASAIPTVSGLQTGDTVTGLTETYANTNAGTGKTLSVATYTVNDGNSGSNYTVSTFTNTTGEITPAALTITANDDNMIYDGTVYSGGNGVTYSGFVATEDADSLSGSLSYSGTSQGATDIGSYIITPGGLYSGNYTIGYVGGTLTITAAVSVLPQNLIYANMLDFSGTTETGTTLGDSSGSAPDAGTDNDGNQGEPCIYCNEIFQTVD